MPGKKIIGLIVAKHLPKAEILLVERMTGGVSADLYRLEVQEADGAQRWLTLRVHGSKHCGHDAALEYQLLTALHAAKLSVPKPLAVKTGANELPHPYLLLEFVDGLTDIPASQSDARIAAMANELAAIHATPTASLPDLPMRLDPVPELLDFLPDEPEWDAFRNWLSKVENGPMTGEPTLLHGDYWPNNVVWEGEEVAATLDWEDAAIGDPVSDVACACVQLGYTYGAAGFERFKNTYAMHRAIDPFRLLLWQAYVAAAENRSMSGWGLPPEEESDRRRMALEYLRQSAEALAVQ